jgi:glycosyltransferase involved in cell wall biosynthesis
MGKAKGNYTLIDSKRVSIVMPAYNEEAVIGTMIDRLGRIREVDEIVVVDDGSNDGTPQAVAAYPHVKLVRHPYNIGNGAAIKSGIRAAAM